MPVIQLLRNGDVRTTGGGIDEMRTTASCEGVTGVFERFDEGMNVCAARSSSFQRAKPFALTFGGKGIFHAI